MRASLPRFAPPSSINHYAALNLPLTATAPEIKKQFYRLSKEFHPDRVLHRSAPDRARARSRFDAVSEAYSVLGHADRKREYDERMRASFAANTAAGYSSSSSGTNPYYRTPGERRSQHYSGLNRTRTRARTQTTQQTAADQRGSGEYGQYETVFGRRVPRGSHPYNPMNSGLGGGYATGLNDDVPHFDYEKHMKQQQAYEQFRTLRAEARAQPHTYARSSSYSASTRHGTNLASDSDRSMSTPAVVGVLGVVSLTMYLTVSVSGIIG
ncbi:hypothetical protein BZA70DRAFT_297088 [Myxozyma melibiosi]|uniref:J domain-containing protein n=1 Tax=Myxozyma melibiosi TaxID=54550 RepID=A0ABR1F0D2_9ASCO